MININIRDEYIKLGQALKLAGAVSSGLEAKIVINEGMVKVNGEICTQRGKKLVKADIISYEGKEYIISKDN